LSEIAISWSSVDGKWLVLLNGQLINGIDQILDVLLEERCSGDLLVLALEISGRLLHLLDLEHTSIDLWSVLDSDWDLDEDVLPSEAILDEESIDSGRSLLLVEIDELVRKAIGLD